MAIALEAPLDFHDHAEVICLNLTPEEAAALYTVCRYVSGKPDTTRRGLIDNVVEALKRLDSVMVLASDKHAMGDVRFSEVL